MRRIGNLFDRIDVSHEVVIPDISSLRMIDSYATNIGYLARGYQCHRQSGENDKMVHVGDYSLDSAE